MRLRISIVVPGLPFSPGTLEEGSLGGSESAGAYMARELAKRGHQIYVFREGPPEEGAHGEFYLPLGDAAAFIGANPHDICIAQRVPDLLSRPTAARLNVLWQHDLALARDSGRFRGVLWNVDKVMVLSEFMREQYMAAHGLPKEAFWRTRNGVDVDLIDSIEAGERDEKLLVYASRPERGLDVLLGEIMPRLPDHRLVVTSYENRVDHLAGFYAHCRELASRLGDRVSFSEPLSKPELYRLYKSAGALVYPTPSPIAPRFREISCITAMEAQACGLPMVTSALGALPETLSAEAGVLVDGDPTEDAGTYAEEFAESVKLACVDADLRAAGPEIAKVLRWDGLAEEWEREIIRLVEERNDDPRRLFRHFVRRSDIVAAREVGRRHPDQVPARLRDRLEEDYAFAWDKEKFREHYAKIGETHTDCYEAAKVETRLQYLRETLQQRKDVKRVVDYGCGLGIYAIELSNACPWIEFLGVDVDERTIEMAREYRGKYAKQPDSVTFVVGDETYDVSHFDPDLVLACEVLEHVAEPWEFLRRIEEGVREDAEFLLTVPYGPWEHMSYDTYPFRCHLWEFEMEDLRDMLDGKPNVSVQSMGHDVSARTGHVLGWNFVTYQKGEAAPKPIDLDRKIRFQRPEEGVTAFLMAGGKNAIETLRWSLRSVAPHVDEIVVADCGLEHEDRNILRQEFRARIVPSQDPREIGFEVPRNDGLAAVDTDWALWIDTDEKLMGGRDLWKYLRRNVYSGYSIKQHHFSVDGAFAPDMPVRLFRKKRYDGTDIRFYGMIHEHPETALNEGPGPVLILPDVNIAHVGYLDEAVRRQRFARNHPLLQRDIEKYPDRILQKLFIMRDHQLLIDYELQRNGGRVTETIRGRAEEIKRLFREHYLGRTTYQNVDALQYYTRALEVLGEGIEVDFSLGAARDGQGSRANGPTRARFLTADEAKIEIGHRLEREIAPLTSEHW